eukprot:scaffold2462_cov402-Prasinococcus_capsulatus_cf.AAC.8
MCRARCARGMHINHYKVVYISYTSPAASYRMPGARLLPEASCDLRSCSLARRPTRQPRHKRWQRRAQENASPTRRTRRGARYILTSSVARVGTWDLQCRTQPSFITNPE